MTEPPCRSETKSPCLAKKFLDKVILHRKLFWIIALLIFTADLWTKDIFISYVHDQLGSDELGKVYWVCDDWFGLVEIRNTGTAWGLLSDWSGFLLGLRLIALVVILYILVTTPDHQKLQILSLALVMGGALGNIWDTVVYSYVRDFLYFDFDIDPADPWPAFNLADSAICVGVCLLFIWIVRSAIVEKKKGKAKEEKALPNKAER